MTLEELQIFCQEWQAILRLQDWDIDIRFVDREEIEDGRRGADIEWFAEKQCAKIRVLDPTQQRKDPFVPYNPELSVIHELLHLHLAPFAPDQGTPLQAAEEVAVHRISEALLKLKQR